jgi:hypothetical protein
MGKGSTRRPEDRKAIEANWPFGVRPYQQQGRGDWYAPDWSLETPPIANTNEEQASKLPKE